MSKLAAWLLGGVVLTNPSLGQEYAGIPSDVDFPSAATSLDAMRAAGDLSEQRDHLWQVFLGLTRPSADPNIPVFLTWYGAGEVFAKAPAPPSPTLRGLSQTFSLPAVKDHAHSSAAPLIIRAHYNLPAYTHIRSNGLNAAARLFAIATEGVSGSDIGEVNSIPPFPRDSVVVKSVWWPVPADGVVALPVWDPASNPPRKTGNDYLTWSRVVAVSAKPDFGADGAGVEVEFLGRAFKHVHAVGIDSLYHVTLDQRTADSLMLDPDARKVAALVLGRPLRASDRMVLVALHLATRELTDWLWGTFWWHDQPGQGPFAPPSHTDVHPPWRNYLMSVSFDTELPREPDGGPHIAFNPWLEGRFPDSGHGGGVVSNCMTCHRRASTTAQNPFLVTRGLENAFQPIIPGVVAVTTSSLWSLPLQAR